MYPLIGIPAAEKSDAAWHPLFVGHRKSYIDSVLAAGGIPVLLPLIEDEPKLRELYEHIDGLLLAGGQDINPELYGEASHAKTEEPQRNRDAVEMQLVRWAAAEGKPVLGICRGIQVVNVALGGTLYQDIDDQINGGINHYGSYHREDWGHMAHEIVLDNDSAVAAYLGVSSLETNSLHHQSIKEAAPGLRVVGRAPDGVIEAVEGTSDNFVVGIQCHPEALQAVTDPRWRGLFSAFVARCAAYRSHSIPA